MGQNKVLLVDDELSYLEVMSKRLARKDLVVATAPGGVEGLEALAADPGIDVVILDIKMPGMDGIQTLGEIRRRHPSVKVILLTAHATVDSAVEGMALGAFDYLFKPCDMNDLTRLIAEARSAEAAPQSS
jgi:DNA-binding NtrC family response regulator